MRRTALFIWLVGALPDCTTISGIREPDGGSDASATDASVTDASVTDASVTDVRPPSGDRLLPRDASCALSGDVPPGTLDRSFSRRLDVGPRTAGTPFEFAPTQIIEEHDGRYLVAGYGPGCRGGSTLKDGWVLRYRSDGTLDDTWGDDGRVCFDGTLAPNNRDQAFLGMTLDPQGRAVVVGFDHIPGTLRAMAARFTRDGALDATFGAGGVAHFATMLSRVTASQGVAYDLAIDRERLIVAGTDNFLDTTTTLAFVQGLTVDGQADTRFASGRTAFGQLGHAFAAVAAVTEGYVAVGSSRFGEHLYAARFTTAGTLDPSFGDRGESVIEALGDASGRAVIEVPEGYIVAGAAGVTAQDAVVVKLTRAGALDPTFGVAGVARLGFRWNWHYQLRGALARMCDGRLLVAGLSPAGPRVARLLANGTPDPSFARDGTLDVTPDVAPGILAFATLSLDPRGAHATLLVNDFRNQGPAVFRFSL